MPDMYVYADISWQQTHSIGGQMKTIVLWKHVLQEPTGPKVHIVKETPLYSIHRESEINHAITTPSKHTHPPENLSHGGGAKALNVGSASCFAFGGMEVGGINVQATQENTTVSHSSPELPGADAPN